MSSLTAEEAVKWLEGARWKGEKNGLHNTKALLEALGSPEKSFRSLHVAGTNGKGSTAAIAERVLREAGYRTGLYTSPYLCAYQERVRVNGVPIPEDALVRIVESLMDVCSRLLPLGIRPTTFELGTALAFQYFREAGVEIAVVEVGLGGRLDSTNVIAPDVSLIAAIGLDHMKTLGNTIEEIAREKAGIIKPNVPVVVEAQSDRVMDVFLEAAREAGAPLIVAQNPEPIRESAYGSSFSLPLPAFGAQTYDICLPGRHQVANACLALTALDALAQRGRVQIAPEIARRGLQTARWPGRLEWIGDVLLDGAHNPQGAETLALFLKRHLPNRQIILVTGMMQDKQIDACASILAPVVSQVIATQVEYERAASAEGVADAFRMHGSAAKAVPDIRCALEEAKAAAGNDGVVIIAGSLYLVGDVRKLLLPEAVSI